MRLQLLPEAFKEALDVAAPAIDRKATLPVLANVLLEATTDGGLVITGTDTQTRAWHTVPAKVEAAGAVALPPKALSEFLEAVPRGEAVSLEVDRGHKATLISGRTRVRVAGHDPEGFPPTPERGGAPISCTVPGSVLRALIASVAFAASDKDVRPVLAGVLIQVRDGRLVLCAADGLRLARREAMLADAPDLEVIVKADRLAAIGKSVGETDEPMQMTVTEQRTHLLIEASSGSWALKLLSGEFPDATRIIPQDPVTVVSMPTAGLERASKLIRGILTDVMQEGEKRSTRRAKAVLTISRDSVQIVAADTSSDHEASVELETVLERGEPLQIALDSVALRQAQAAIGGERIALEIVEPRKAVALRPVGESAREHVHVLMPMSVPNVAGS